MMSIRTMSMSIFAGAALLLAGNAYAHEHEHDYDRGYACPEAYFNTTYEKANGTVVPPTGLTMDQEFGDGTEAITHCLQVRHNAKVVVSINGAHPSDKNGNIQKEKARFLSNLEYFRENYEVVHGMKIGRDVKVAAVAASHGALLMTTQHPAWIRAKASNDEPTCMGNEAMFAGKTCTNPFREDVERAMSYGIKFYVCQMASRTLGITMATKIPGVEFVPGAHLAVADFQLRGYALIDL